MRMRRFLSRAFVLAALLSAPALAGAGAGPALPPQPPPPDEPRPADDGAAFRATAAVVAEPVEVGEVFEVEVAVAHPPDAEAAPILEAALGEFRVLGADRAPPTDGTETAPEGSRFLLRLGAFVLPGDHEIPAIPVGIRTGGGGLAQIETPPTPVRVVSSLPADDEEAAADRQDIHDLRGPFLHEVPPRWGVIGLWTLAALVLALVAWWLWRRRRGAAEEPVVPLPPPAVEAEAALARLANSGLLAAGEVVRFYERLAGIMKRYAGRRFGAAWAERTTGEILHDLRARPLGAAEAALPLLAGVLLEADLAKFSDRPFRPAAAEARFTEAGLFLDRTRPSVAAEDDAEAGDAPSAQARSEEARSEEARSEDLPSRSAGPERRLEAPGPAFSRPLRRTGEGESSGAGGPGRPGRTP